MTGDLLNTILLSLAFSFLFGIAELLYHFVKVKAEITRKIVHIVTGVLTLLFPLLLSSHWYVLLLCGLFFIILILSVKLNLLPSINKVGRITYGSMIYPIIVYGCYLVFTEYNSLTFFYVPVLILALCDPVAEIVGKNLTWKKYRIFGHTKTLSGSLGFAVAATIVTSIFIYHFQSVSILKSIMLGIILAFFTTIAEGISHKGFDNFTIPLTSTLILIFYSYYNLI